jgi:hypothetical protein
MQKSVQISNESPSVRVRWIQSLIRVLEILCSKFSEIRENEGIHVPKKFQWSHHCDLPAILTSPLLRRAFRSTSKEAAAPWTSTHFSRVLTMTSQKGKSASDLMFSKSERSLDWGSNCLRTIFQLPFKLVDVSKMEQIWVKWCCFTVDHSR